MVGRIVAGFLALGLTVVMAGGIWLGWMVMKPGPLIEDKLVYFPAGTSVAAISRQLENDGVVTQANLFHLAARVAGRRSTLKAGEYNIPARASMAGVLSLLQSGKTYQRRLTVPEGLMAVEIVALLQREDALTGEIETMPVEGTLLPETYNFSRGDTRQSVIDRMQRAMTTVLAELWENRVDGLPVKTPQDAVILASVVEKETGVAAERPRVAGVFVNRLKMGMPLQSDPTVIYALTQGKSVMTRPLTKADLKTVSLYNTYAVRGLPVGPIANPGRASLSAVMQPEVHGFYYFVADGTGGHAFGKTLKEHNDNVANWRRIQRGAQP